MSRPAAKRRILIVGEGRETEYNYFVGFRKHLEEDLNATATTIKVARGKGGGAMQIVRHAVQEKKKFEPDRRRGDRVLLLMDVENETRIGELPAAENLARKQGVEIFYSCPAFEFWLLCHFSNAPRRYYADCAQLTQELVKKWRTVAKTPYDKRDSDIFDRLSFALNLARTQAAEIDLHHMKSVHEKRYVNPSSQVYQLVAILIGARTGEKCPLAGSWQLVTNPHVRVSLDKGVEMPTHDEGSAHWKLAES